MSVELRPLGVTCNIACDYCYQKPQRDAGNISQEYDVEVMKRAIEEEGGPFTIFGGEPLMIPKRDLEHLWEWGFEKFGHNSIQTNGILINEGHIRMFRKYNVRVGISVDGPGELNDLRWAGSAEKTRIGTAKSEAAIVRLCQENLAPSIILTLHRENAGPAQLPILLEWLRWLDRIGIPSARLHLLESEEPWIRNRLAMSMDENIQVLMDIAALEPELRSMQLDIFHEVEKLLQGDETRVACTWRACDPYTTAAVRGVEGMGQRSNCGRTNKDGIDFVKADKPGYERYIGLYFTPQEYGGCEGCRFFLMCKGQCPGTAIDGDWRNRTEHCDIWMQLFEYVEKKLLARDVMPLSLSPKRLEIELALTQQWALGQNPKLAKLSEKMASPSAVSSAKNSPSGSTEFASEEPTVTREAWDSTVPVTRLDFAMPSFSRIAWVSDTARRVWAPVLEKIVMVGPLIFAHAVKTGLYSCATVQLPTEAVSASKKSLQENLGMAMAVLEGDRETSKCVIGAADDVERFQLATLDAQQEMLGVPLCCQTFHAEAKRRGFSDTTLLRALNTIGIVPSDNIVSLQNETGLLNTLLSPLGIRLVSHEPCSMSCTATNRLASGWLEAGRANALEQEVLSAVEEMMSWPVEWSALHGTAEVKTPILKLSVNTDATGETFRVKLISDRYPLESTQGIRFPYKQPPPTPIDKRVIALVTPTDPGADSPPKIDKAVQKPKRAVATLALRPRSSVILDETFVKVREGISGDLPAIKSIFLSNYFNIIQLDDLSIGAATNYCRFKSEDAAMQSTERLKAMLPSDPSLLSYLFAEGELDLLQLNLKTCLVSALSQRLLHDPLGFDVSNTFEKSLMPDVGSAVVIGFGGYMNYLINHTNTPRIHICDLSYRKRYKRMDATVNYYQERYPDKVISVSNGSDMRKKLKNADLVSITGSAFSSGTLEGILEASSNCTSVILQGQSASIWPEALFERGVTTISTTIKPENLMDVALTDPEEFKALLEGKLRPLYLRPNILV